MYMCLARENYSMMSLQGKILLGYKPHKKDYQRVCIAGARGTLREACGVAMRRCQKHLGIIPLFHAELTASCCLAN